MSGIRMLPAGEQGLVVEFGQTIDSAVNSRVHQTAKLLNKEIGDAIFEIVPTYRSLLVYFNPLRMTRADLIQQIETMLKKTENCLSEQDQKQVVMIPVCYGGDFGPDLDFVARHNGLSTEEVVKIHTSDPYQVYMIGFTPGFPYLGGMSERIATPRLDKPRIKIPAGSVGIAGSQTGFYPMESPGGWRLIGRTPVKAFDPQASNPFLFDAGQYLQFKAITEEEYRKINREVDAGTYSPVTQIHAKGGSDI
ncbi:MAG: 5-oxoprolinase subunit PxpB [Negativicutes bacterium]